MTDSRRSAETAPGRMGTTDRRAVARRIGWLIVALAFAIGSFSAMRRASQGRPDWGDLQTESRYVWEHGHTAPGTAMFGYLPTTTFALWPFTVWTGWPVGPGLFVLSNVLAGLGTIWVVRRWWIAPHAAGSYVCAVLLVGANFAHAIQSNQMTMWTLFLCVAGLTLVERRHRAGGRDVSGESGFQRVVGGLLLGLAALIKTMPLLMAGYLLLRRRWRGLAGMALAVVLFDALPSVAYFGWSGAVEEHRAWLRRAEWHSNRRQIEEPLLRVHRHGHNSSYAAVLTRWLRPTPGATRQVILYGQPPPDVVAARRAALAPDEVLTLDPMPPREGGWSERRVDIAWVPQFHVAELPPGIVWWLWSGSLVVGFLVLTWATWSTGRRAGVWPAVGAMWMLAMFWPSPMARHYYLAWAFPAIAVVWSALARHVQMADRGGSAGARLAVAALVAWGIGLACLGWHLGRWYGIHLAVLALLMAATAWAWRRAVGSAEPQSHEVAR